MPKQVVVAQYSAEGGPEKPFMAADGHEAGPTDAEDAALYGIHLKPLELDEMVRRKFMRKGARVVVHSYGEVLVPFPKGAASGPYELHIYPGGHKLVIVGTSK